MSIRRQCELLGLNRSSFYYEPATETIENLRLMRRIDEQYLKTPFYGSRRMAVVLASEGEEVNRKRVQRLMGLMGLEAIHPGPRTTVRNSDHKVYPYLLRGVKIERRDQVWSSDITDIPMHQGFMYLTAVIDWYSRYVLSWSLSNSTRWSVLPGEIGRGLEGRKAGDLQYRSGGAIDGKIIHGSVGIGWRAGVACSPQIGPSGMRVILARLGRRTFDEAYPPLARADHPQAP